MSKQPIPTPEHDSYAYLSETHRQRTDVKTEWDQDNQQWWNWYLTLAENDSDSENLAAQIDPLRDEADIDVNEDKLVSINEGLSSPYSLQPESIRRYERDGYIKLKNVLDPDSLAILRRRITAILVRELGPEHGLAFRSDEMMWLRDDLVRCFVLSKRVAQIVAELMGVRAVRLYHDNTLSKEPGCGRTPWHYDFDHFPIDSLNVCTAWIPLQKIPENMGPLSYAAGIERYKLIEELPFSKFDASYDKQVAEIFSKNDVAIEDSSFDLGEVSFHHTLSFHTAGPNHTNIPRMVLATTYFEDGARLVSNPTMISGDFRKFMPGIEPGEVIDSSYNPVCYDSAEAGAKNQT